MQTGSQTGFRASTQLVLTLRDLSHAGRDPGSGSRGRHLCREHRVSDGKERAGAGACRSAGTRHRQSAAACRARCRRELGAKGVELISVGEPPQLGDGEADLGDSRRSRANGGSN